MQIGLHIRKIRELRGLSQEALADQVGISQKQLSRIEQDQVSPRLNLIIAFCDALEVDLIDLMTFNDQVFLKDKKTQHAVAIPPSQLPSKHEIADLNKRLIMEKNRTIDLLQKLLKVYEGQDSNTKSNPQNDSRFLKKL